MKLKYGIVGANNFILSGRIISNIEHDKIYIDKKSDDKIDKVTFVIRVLGGKHGNIFRVIAKGKAAKTINKVGRVGSRIIVQGHLESRKRKSSDIKKLAIDLYTIDLIIDDLLELLDAKNDFHRRFELELTQKNIENGVDKCLFPQEFEFDNNY
jgi:single-stranded DNA-binding protein